MRFLNIDFAYLLILQSVHIVLTGRHFRFYAFMGHSPLPAGSSIICQYAAFLARTMHFSSINNYLGIISILHKEFGLNNPLTDNWVGKSLLTGIKQVKGNTVKQKLPLTLNILRGILVIAIMLPQ